MPLIFKKNGNIASLKNTLSAEEETID